MRVAIYTRKSVFSDKSDSVKNQARMCRDYIELHFEGDHVYSIYEDEAYTGANTARPALQNLIDDIKAGALDFLIVYQLDRLSRNVRDFANIYDILNANKVAFASVKESIDTNTPIGETMMYMSVVFAQMERKTIAARVSDNMAGLAGSGWWIGGNPPFGYRRLKVVDDTGKKHTTIEPVPEQAERVRWFFDEFTSGQYSLQSFETYCKHRNITTPRGGFFSASQLHHLLTMPWCVPADQRVYDYYAAKGCNVQPAREYWTGDNGVSIYGRTAQSNGRHVLNPPENWLVCIGRHQPFIDTDTWLRAQSQFTHNTFAKVRKYPPPLLKGVLRCSCGRLMVLERRKKTDGSFSLWYKCPRRERYGVEYCNMSNIKTHLLDNHVLRIFRSIALDPNTINDYVEACDTEDLTASARILEKEVTAIESKIERLSESLALNESSSASKYIIRSIEKLDSELTAKNNELTALKSRRFTQENIRSSNASKAAAIADLVNNFDSFSQWEQNDIAVKILQSCVWDGSTLFVTL